jgi:hypothetical protein
MFHVFDHFDWYCAPETKRIEARTIDRNIWMVERLNKLISRAVDVLSSSKRLQMTAEISGRGCRASIQVESHDLTRCDSIMCLSICLKNISIQYAFEQSYHHLGRHYT